MPIYVIFGDQFSKPLNTLSLMELNALSADVEYYKKGYEPICNKPQEITEPEWFVEDKSVTQTEYCAGCERNHEPHSHVVPTRGFMDRGEIIQTFSKET